MPIDPQDGGPDDWFAPESDGYPDDWFVPASAAPGTAQPALGPQRNPASAAQPAPRPDPLTAFLSLIPASRWMAPPQIFPDAFGRFPLLPAAPPSAPQIDPTGGLLGGLANLSGTSSSPTYGLFGVLKNPPSGNPAGFPSFQGAGSASGSGDQFAPLPLLLGLANVDSGSRTDQAGLALDQAPAATTTPFSESDTGLAQPISCQGPTCSQGVASARAGCISCPVKGYAEIAL